MNFHVILESYQLEFYTIRYRLF